ncbi:hypothetical protein LAT59_05030 [Candidatus Gracilibacteria bacterium]|nr:hypothetical protein [Candidatus Gracilibacteria bacterium]
MIFRRTKKKAKTSFLSFDKFITGIIIGGAAASIFGLSKTQKGKNILGDLRQVGYTVVKKSFRIFGKVSVGFLNIFSKKK